MKQLGKHVLLELWEISSQELNDREWVRRALVRAADEARCTIVSQAFHRFAPQGISGVVVIAESHISVHTWPELGYAAVDIFTCGDHTMPERAAEFVVRYMKAGKHSTRVLERGIPDASTAAA